MRKLIILIGVFLVLIGFFDLAQRYGPSFNLSTPQLNTPQIGGTTKVVTEESVTVDTVKEYGQSVVTVSETVPTQSTSPFDLGPFGFFGPQDQSPQTQGPQNIGSGFIVSSDGLIVTNKHVVSDASGTYQIVTSDDKKYDVEKIYRDPLNDIAIVKIDPGQNPGKTLKPVIMGDSSHLQVGQFVVAIGTALGEFNNTVTTGVISGLGRGIQAGDGFQGYVEQLDNVIQTDAAINPGNSGGPLINSSKQVIGINTAIAQNGQNVGFALPINVVKESLSNFNQTGQFNRPYIGVAYKLITQDQAVANDLVAGAYVQNVVSNSPAQSAGVKPRDIITKVDGEKLAQENQLAQIISKKKVGDSVTLTIWRNGKTQEIKVTLGAAPSQ